MGVSTCGWYRNRLPLLTGNELVGQEQAPGRAPPAGLPGCRHHPQLQETVRVLQAVAAEHEPADTGSIWPALSQQIRESRRPYRVDRPWVVRLARPLAGLAAALALSAVVGWMALRWDRTKPMMGLTQMVTAKPDSKKIRRPTIVRPAPPPQAEKLPLAVDLDAAKATTEANSTQALDAEPSPPDREPHAVSAETCRFPSAGREACWQWSRQPSTSRA